MAGAAGPNTAEAGLVFAYDLGNTTTSYIGEPTTNVIDAVNFTSNISSWNAQENVTITRNQVNPLGVVDNTCIKIHPNSASDNYMGVRGVKFADANANHTFSFWARGNKSYSSFPINFGVIQLTVYVNITTDWQYFTVQTGVNKNFTEHTVHFGGWGTWTDTSFDLFLWRPQIEQKSHATPFVNGTRSTTQGLLNLTGNSTIDITNASFDSNAQLVFDGTNDYIEAPFETILNDCSFEVWFKATSTRTYQYPLAIRNNGVGSSYAFYLDMNDPDGSGFAQTMWVYWNSGGSPYSVVPKTGTYGDWNDSTWRHYVFTRSTTNSPYTLHYMNGSLVSTINRSGDQTTQFGNGAGYKLYLGQYGAGFGYFPGELPIIKIYNRVLSASEVLTNYQALRYRFGI